MSGWQRLMMDLNMIDLNIVTYFCMNYVICFLTKITINYA